MEKHNVIDCEKNELTGEVIYHPTDKQADAMRIQLVEHCDETERCSRCPIFKEHPGEDCIHGTTKNRLAHNYLLAFGDFCSLKCYVPKTNCEKMKEIQQYYGREVQINKCAEECGELIQALMRFRNTDNGDPAYKKNFDNLLEEIADVQITTSEVLLTLGGEESINKKIQDIIDYKLDRQIRRIQDEEER